jgi:hypothetical protein
MRPSCLLVSVVVPAYNEIENLPELYQQLLGEGACGHSDVSRSRCWYRTKT